MQYRKQQHNKNKKTLNHKLFTMCVFHTYISPTQTLNSNIQSQPPRQPAKVKTSYDPQRTWPPPSVDFIDLY